MLLNLSKVSSAILDKDKKIKDAIKSLSKTGLQIVLVINKKKKFLGTVTDGDIRRGILNGIELDSKLEKVTNKKSFYLKEYPGELKVKDIFEKKTINQFPIIQKHKIKYLCINRPERMGNKSQSNKVLIMAGGMGKRLLPLTKKLPKPMIKIGGKPILEHIINELYFQGFKNFLISTHYKANKIKSYFKDGKKFNVSINYLHEKKAKGTAGAIKKISNSKKPVLVMNGDIITNLNFNDFLNFHLNNKNMITVATKNVETRNPYGILKIKNSSIKYIHEKPIENYIINTGFYIVDPKISKFIKKDENLSMTDLIQRLIKKNIKITAFPIHENWTDIGSIEGLRLARKKY